MTKRHPDDDGDETVKRALEYPYDIPSTSYVMVDGKVMPWQGDVELSQRTPVLACGSNQSPTQLQRKFPEGTIPVMAGWLEDYDSVYSAHFTTYGAVAATYSKSPGVRSRQMITWLNEAQLHTMHETEALGVNYTFEKFSDILFASDCALQVTQAYSYQSIRGPLYLEGCPVAIRAIQAQGRRVPSMDEAELQAVLMPVLSNHNDIENFVMETILDAEERKRRTRKLVELGA